MSFEDLKPQFLKQEDVGAQNLAQARKQLHYTIFTLQAVAAAYAPFQEDSSHISFQWNRESGAFLSGKIPGKKDGAVFGLILETPAVIQLDSSEKERRRLSMGGVTLAGLQEWLREGVKGMGLDSQTLDFSLSKEMPPHELAQGKPFDYSGLGGALAELKRAYSNAHLFLERIHQENSQFSPVRCWPHDFDLTTLLEFQVSDDPNPKKTLRIGLSPGDSFYETPYYYVTPRPFSMDLTLPPLPSGGRWRLEDRQGAVMTHEALLRSKELELQFKAVSDFLLTTRQIGLHFLKVGQKR